MTKLYQVGDYTGNSMASGTICSVLFTLLIITVCEYMFGTINNHIATNSAKINIDRSDCYTIMSKIVHET